jgi:hypothetical protein
MKRRSFIRTLVAGAAASAAPASLRKPQAQTLGSGDCVTMPYSSTRFIDLAKYKSRRERDIIAYFTEPSGFLGMLPMKEV